MLATQLKKLVPGVSALDSQTPLFGPKYLPAEAP